MYSSTFTPEDLRDCRRYARAVISASFISSLRHVQTLRRMDDSIEKIREKMKTRPKTSNNLMETTTTTATSTTTTTPRIKITLPCSTPNSNSILNSNSNLKSTVGKEKERQPQRPKNWSPITDGKKAICAMIDQIWSIPYAPCRYYVQFICTVSLCALQRHKYCVRWQNGRRSAMFYVNIDENESNTTVWVNFPGETKALSPQYSVHHFHRFLQRNLF